ncbi:hypothetical protein [Streptomyces sp. WG-D5]
MSDHWPTPHPAPMPGPPPAARFGASYRRWARILLGLAIVVASLVLVALVASFVLLAKADADVNDAAYGYLALFLWFGIAAAIPLVLALGIPGVLMTRRARQQERAQAGFPGNPVTPPFHR